MACSFELICLNYESFLFYLERGENMERKGGGEGEWEEGGDGRERSIGLKAL